MRAGGSYEEKPTLDRGCCGDEVVVMPSLLDGMPAGCTMPWDIAIVRAPGWGAVVRGFMFVAIGRGSHQKIWSLLLV